MISVNEARKILAENLTRGGSVEIQVSEAAGYVVYRDIVSPADVPAFDNSAMDGYALAWGKNRESWTVVVEIPAGSAKNFRLSEGEAARIFTGSPMPEGADTVIPQEQIERTGNIIQYTLPGFGTGANVRYKGTQIRTGELMMQRGTLLSAGGVGLLASVGFATVEVFAPPVLSVIVTGSELRTPGEPLTHGAIFDSNSPMLKAALNRLGVRKIYTSRVADNEPELRKNIEKELNKSDVVIISGGISVGDYDFVKTSLAGLGVKELFYKVKQRPGKPIFAGKLENKWVFALPGNPASVLSCFSHYVKPCIRYFMGHNNVWNPDITLPLAEDSIKKKGLTFFMKAYTENGKVHLAEGQQSFNLIAFSKADCFAELPEDVDFVEAGTSVNIYFL
ncbi:molybdopterin molybdotransferase MoeA [Gaoshiqia sediminis]|uniref:Molybdopterin molybdenumtransferase n=1 Tax=Gaoshiqia sediminis TaxID=2986998 RepID=A0AA41Y7G8_9BACT|nr:gephyrin-like molybdotransferase Glp [Gaoshiqia sediminis]MCW0482308.1 molybdopterin molybdotransferase MoeA [Gaoshiqia sediminis]